MKNLGYSLAVVLLVTLAGWGQTAVAPINTPVPANAFLICGSDGTNCNPLRVNTNGQLVFVTSQAGADGQTNTLGILADITSNNRSLEVASFVFNGATWDRHRSASSANLPTSQTSTARNSVGAILTEKGSRFVSFSNPAAGTVASLVWALEAGVKHTADCISFSASSVVAPVLTALTVNLRDGASGAGTILGTWTVAISATTGQNVAPFGICGLNAVGTAGTAMTLEFSAALGNLSQSVTLSGFNVN